MRVPIIPPYCPLQGVTRSPERKIQRRPSMGRMADEQSEIEKQYMPKALEIVRRLWGTHSARDIAVAIQCATGYHRADPKLVYGLHARIDREHRPAED